MYLLDTNVVSEMRRTRPHGAVSAWFASIDPSILFVSAVTVGEIQRGIEKTRLGDPRRAAELETWLDIVISTHQLVDMDSRSFRLWARLVRQHPQLLIDAMIAATAITRGLTVVTRNVDDFQLFEARVLNPFDASSSPPS